MAGSKKGNRTAFFYGTLMAPQVLYRVIYLDSKPNIPEKDLPTVKPALLEGFRRHRVRSQQYPAIRPCEASTVRGSVVTGLTASNIRALDIFEGPMYERQKVKVKELKDVGLNESTKESSSAELVGEVEAETYVWIEELADKLEEGEWDFEEFKREKMVYWTGESSDQNPDIEVDEGFADVDRAAAEEGWGDDPTGGRGANGSITRQLESMQSSAKS